MHIVILLGFVATFLILELPQNQVAMPQAPPWILPPAVLIYLSAVAGLGAAVVRLAAPVVLGRAAADRAARRRHSLLTLLSRLWLIAGQGALVWLGFGRWAALQMLPLAAKAVALMPFIAAVLLSWRMDYPLHVARRAAAGAGAWRLGEYLLFNVRHHLLFLLVPVGLIILLADSVRLYVGPLFADEAVRDTVIVAGDLIACATVLLCAPLLIVRIWRTERLPASPLRTELEAMCRTMKLRFREILVWQSRGVIANAGVMGLAAPARYILLSDALLDELAPDHVRAVFAHEAGHIIHHHIPNFVLFTIAAIGLSSGLAHLLTHLAGLPDWADQLVMLGLLAAAWAFAFGWVSRRFERQSDVTGAWAAGNAEAYADGQITPEGAAVFAAGLQRVAELNGLDPAQRNWRHGSVNARVRYILSLAESGGTRQQVDRQVRRIKILLWIAAGAGAALLATELLLGLFAPAAC